MADVLTKEQRHKNMKNNRAKDTKIEEILSRYLGIIERQEVGNTLTTFKGTEFIPHFIKCWRKQKNFDIKKG